MSNEIHDHIEEHHTSIWLYVFVCLGLFALTAITVYSAGIDLGGKLNIILAMVIASIKASVVALFFMHLKFEDKLTWVYALYPLFLLFLLIFFTLIETFTRVPVLK